MNKDEKKLLLTLIETADEMVNMIEEWADGDNCMACEEPQVDGLCRNKECALLEYWDLRGRARKAVSELRRGAK